MTFSTLMVHLELEHSNDARLRIAGDLAEQFDAKLIGIAACDPQPAYYADGAFAQGLRTRARRNQTANGGNRSALSVGDASTRAGHRVALRDGATGRLCGG